MSKLAPTLSLVPPVSTHGVMIRACAGAGKTTALVDWYINLLLKGENPSRVLATTFTRKAAHEIKERVLTKLADGVITGPLVVRDLDGAPIRVDQERAQALLSTFVAQLSSISITTLDAFFAKIAGAFGPELGIPNDWQLVDEVKYHRRQSGILQQMLSKLDPSTLIDLMRDADYYSSSKLAFSSLLQSISDLYGLFRESRKEAWGAITIPEPPCRSMAELTELLVHADLPKNKNGTVDSRVAGAIGRLSAAVRAENPLAAKLRNLIRESAFSTIREKGSYYNKEISFELIEVLNDFAAHAAHVLLPELSSRSRGLYQVLKQYHKAYTESINESGELVFNDLKELIALAANKIELQEMFYRLDTQYHHLLLDEFQDTSINEWRAIEPMAAEIISKLGAENTFFCVGDTKQAIYGWRGGVAEIFDQLAGGWSHLAQREKNISFRSAPEVVEFVNTVFSALPAAAHEALFPAAITKWCAQFAAHDVSRKQARGFVLIEEVQRQEQEPITEEGDEGESASSAELQAAGKFIKRLLASGFSGTIGVLSRSNQGVAAVRSELSAIGVESSEEGGVPLSDSPTVQSICSLFQLFDHPQDSQALVHLSISLLGSALGLTPAGNYTATTGVLQNVRRLCDEQGIGKFLKEVFFCEKGLGALISERERLQVKKVITLAIQLDQNGGSNEAGFREFRELINNSRVEDPTAAQVRVMTVHKSKGLEFDCVVLPELYTELVKRGSDSYLAHRENALTKPTMIVPAVAKEIRELSPELVAAYQYQREEALKESLSVLYVALTRARDALYIPLPIRKPRRSESEGKLSTFADIIRVPFAAESSGGELGEATPSRILYSAGSENWWQHTGHDSKGRGEQNEAAVSELGMNPPTVAWSSAVKYQRYREQLPSQLEGPAIEGFSLSRSRAQRLGTVLHRALELHGWLENPESIDLRELVKQAARVALCSPADVDEVFERLVKFSTTSSYRELFSKAHYLERWQGVVDEIQVKSELPYVIAGSAGRLVRGKIDRVVLGSRKGVPACAHIVDYKTGAEAGAEQSQYQNQLEHYKEAVGALFALSAEKIAANVCQVPGSWIVDAG